MGELGLAGVRRDGAKQRTTIEQEDDQMEAIALIFALMSILLIIGIVGTVIAITHLVYQSEGRDQHLIRDWDSREP